jgi:hypothetical protein
MMRMYVVVYDDGVSLRLAGYRIGEGRSVPKLIKVNPCFLALLIYVRKTGSIQ